MTAFDDDLQRCRQDLDDSWRDVEDLLAGLTDADMNRGVRGEWTIIAVLEHVLLSEFEYIRMVADLRGQHLGPTSQDRVRTIEDARDRLAAARAAFELGVEGVDEDTLYELKMTHHHQEYSVRSVILNNATHNREHTAQIRAILSMT